MAHASPASAWYDHAPLHPHALAGKHFARVTAIPTHLAVVDSYLVSVEMGVTDSVVKVFRRDGGELVHATGRLGSGPGEFRDIWSIQAHNDHLLRTPGVWAYDASLRRLTWIDVSPAGRRVEARGRPFLSLRPSGTLTAAQWYGDTIIIGLGFLTEGRIAVFNRSGDQVRALGPLPADDSSIPPRVLQHAYQGYLGVKPDGALIVVANRHAGRMELLRPTGERVHIVRGPYYFEPAIRVARGHDSARTPVFAVGDDLRFGYLSVAVTDSAIFALFSGRLQKAFPREANYGQFVHVFDWNGKFLRAYDLGMPIFSLAVEPSGNMLYATRHEPEPAIVSFELPQD